ncbi:MAG: hypothetical protein JO316_20470 [Abitibacteriaceae bacterium]|nr:hypothetical protein [Abditibacteriaceae bacterium]
MQESTIKRNIIILLVVTFLLLVIMAVAWGFALNRPLLENIAKEHERYDTRSAVAAKLPQALIDQTKAEQQKVYVANQLAFFQQRYRHLDFDYGSATDPKEVQDSKKLQTWQRYMNEYFSSYGLSLKNELLNAADASGVSINTAIKISPPPKVPEELPPTPPGFLTPIDSAGNNLAVTIVGTYPSIIDFFNRINTSSILMAISPVKLEGASPGIKVTFTVTPFLVQTGSAVKVSPSGGAAPVAAAPPPVAGSGGAGKEAPPADEPDVSVNRPKFGASKGSGD